MASKKNIISLGRSFQFSLRLAFGVLILLVLNGCSVPQSRICKEDSDCSRGAVCSAGTCINKSLLENPSDTKPSKKDGGVADVKPKPDFSPERKVKENVHESSLEKLTERTSSSDFPKGKCKPGLSQKCFSGKPSAEGKGVCKAGTQLCASNRAWGVCKNQILPEPEHCDGKDNDCDGKIDEIDKCPKQILGLPIDFSVNKKETAFLVYRSKMLGLLVTCIDQKGKMIRKSYQVDKHYDHKKFSGFHFSRVWGLSKSGRFLLVWRPILRSSAAALKDEVYYQMFDSNCRNFGERNLLPKSAQSNGFKALAVAENDSFGMALYDAKGNLSFHRFDASGKNIGKSMMLYPAKRAYCITPSFSFSINGKGQAVFMCYGYKDQRHYFRRFNYLKRTFTDNKVVPLQVKRNSSKGGYVRMNSQGSFILSWNESRGIIYSFFDAKGVNKKTVVSRLDSQRFVKSSPVGSTFAWGSKATRDWFLYDFKGSLLSSIMTHRTYMKIVRSPNHVYYGVFYDQHTNKYYLSKKIITF